MMVISAFKKKLHPSGSNLPPPRPGVRHVKFKRLGILVADDELRRRVDRLFHRPMIILALLVLPVLAIEHLYLNPDQYQSHDLAAWICRGALALIWFAFLTEFVLKIMIAECRIEYVRRNWLDVIIILLPVLRPLRVAAVARTSRVFTLRGVGVKFLRYAVSAAIGLEATERILKKIGVKPRSPGQKQPEQMTRYQLMDEIKLLRKRTDQWEQWHAAEQEYLASMHVDCQDLPELPTEEADFSPKDEDDAQKSF